MVLVGTIPALQGVPVMSCSKEWRTTNLVTCRDLCHADSTTVKDYAMPGMADVMLTSQLGC